MKPVTGFLTLCLNALSVWLSWQHITVGWRQMSPCGGSGHPILATPFTLGHFHCSSCMASGGGSHPSHLPISTPRSSSSLNQAVGSSLQTPDASALFISSLGDSGGRNSGNNFAPSPLDHTHSFTSLEELLSVTGISSVELDLSGGKQDGVDSLQRMAKEVESNQGWLSGFYIMAAGRPSAWGLGYCT